MKKLILMIGFCFISGCGEASTYELVAIANECGGVEKVHSLWFDLTTTKAYCLDGSEAGNWRE